MKNVGVPLAPNFFASAILYCTLFVYFPESRQLSNNSISRPKLNANTFSRSGFAHPLSISDS